MILENYCQSFQEELDHGDFKKLQFVENFVWKHIYLNCFSDSLVVILNIHSNGDGNLTVTKL